MAQINAGLQIVNSGFIREFLSEYRVPCIVQPGSRRTARHLPRLRRKIEISRPALVPKYEQNVLLQRPLIHTPSSDMSNAHGLLRKYFSFQLLNLHVKLQFEIRFYFTGLFNL